jgi:hypothetical protein
VLFLVSKLLCFWGFRSSGMWNFVACLVVVDVSKDRVVFKSSGTSNRVITLWNKATNISNLEFCASLVKTQPSTQRAENISEYPILLRHCLTQHALTMSFTNEAFAGDNNHRCQTCHYLQLIRSVSSYCRQTEHEQDVQLSWVEQEQGKCDSPVSLLRVWPVAVQLVRLRAAWLTTDSPTSNAKRCVVDY